MWVTDFLADHLTHDIDVAEARRPRANKAFVHKQLVVDIANVLVPCLAGMGAYDESDDVPSKRAARKGSPLEIISVWFDLSALAAC